MCGWIIQIIREEHAAPLFLQVKSSAIFVKADSRLAEVAFTLRYAEEHKRFQWDLAIWEDMSDTDHCRRDKVELVMQARFLSCFDNFVQFYNFLWQNLTPVIRSATNDTAIWILIVVCLSTSLDSCLPCLCSVMPYHLDSYIRQISQELQTVAGVWNDSQFSRH